MDGVGSTAWARRERIATASDADEERHMDEARLRSVPLFSSLSDKEIARVARHADEVDLPAGRELVREGSFAYELFAIEEGTAEVRQGDQRINELGPGDFFGEIAVMSSGRRTATVVTTSPMTAVVMTASDFRALSRDLPDVVDKIRSAIEERTRDVAS
jgi:CRP-like cAMP-binding protein